MHPPRPWLPAPTLRLRLAHTHTHKLQAHAHQGWVSLLHTFLEAACSCSTSALVCAASTRACAAPQEAARGLGCRSDLPPWRPRIPALTDVGDQLGDLLYTAYPSSGDLERARLGVRQKHQAKLESSHRRVLARRRPSYSYRGYGGRRSSRCFPAQSDRGHIHPSLCIHP